MLNNLALWIYLIEIINNFEFCLAILILLLIIALILIVIVWAINYDCDFRLETQKEFIKPAKFISKSLFFSLLIAIFFPSKPTMYAMLGINTLKELVSHPKVDDLTSKSLLLLENKINQLLEIKEKKDE